MSKSSQLIHDRTFATTVGGWTLWVVIYEIIFTIIVITQFFLPGLHRDTSPVENPSWIQGLVVFHIFTMIVSIVLLVVYIMHAIKNTRLDESARIIWLLLIFFIGSPAMAVYWYLQIWKPVSKRRK